MREHVWCRGFHQSLCIPEHEVVLRQLDSDLEFASDATAGDIEVEIIEAAGRRGWDAFAAWAVSQVR